QLASRAWDSLAEIQTTHFEAGRISRLRQAKRFAPECSDRDSDTAKCTIFDCQITISSKHSNYARSVIFGKNCQRYEAKLPHFKITSTAASRPEHHVAASQKTKPFSKRERVIITEKFVFLHFPRTGGTFITDLIMRFFPSAKEIGYHLPRSAVPKKYTHLQVLGAVRNPWEFYVSWYYHVWPRDIATPLHSWLSENGKQQFGGYTYNAVNLGTDNHRLDTLIERLPDEVDYTKRNIHNITKEDLRKIRGTGVGYYTFRFNQLFGNTDGI